MGAYCSTDNAESGDTPYLTPTINTAPQYLGDTCRTVGMSDNLNTNFSLNEHDVSTVARLSSKQEVSLYEESGSLYVSAKRRRSRLDQRKRGTIKQLSKDLNGDRIDLVVQDKSQRKIATLTDSQVDRLLSDSGGGGGGSGGGSGGGDSGGRNTMHRISGSSTETNNTSVYDSVEDRNRREQEQPAQPPAPQPTPAPAPQPAQRVKGDSILHYMETEIDLGRPVTMQRDTKVLTDAEVEALLNRHR